MTAALVLHASCTHCTLLAGGLRGYHSSSFSRSCISSLSLKIPPGKGLHCQAQKEVNDGCPSSEHINDLGTHNEGITSKAEHETTCHVEIVSWRERRITASIVVDASAQRVWDVLTDYGRLSEFIPNLISSEKIPCPYPGQTWVLQRGVQRMIYWNIEAHVVLDLTELFNLETGSELHFYMVDGDFKRYDGKWSLRTGPRPQTTLLHYEVNVVPKIIFPAAFVEGIIKADLPRNLFAIAERAEAHGELSQIPNKLVSLKPVGVNCPEELCEIINTNVADPHWGGFGRVCKLGSHCLADEIHFRRLDDLLENGGVHRQVAATITVKASSKEVWNVLTTYEALPEFVPNLTNSMVLSREGKRVRLLQEGCKCLLYMVLHARVILDLWEQPEQEISFQQVEGDFSFLKGNWTLSQLGSHHTVLKYSVDTKILKDCILAESLMEEVIYEDVPSNLCAIRDRVESLTTSAGSLAISPPDSSESVLLSRSEVPNGSADCEASEFDDAESPRKDSKIQQARTRRDSLRDPVIRRCSPVKGLMTDFRVLEKELRDFISAHGIEGVIPVRKQLREHWRSDLEKAIRAMGGFHTVAARMKLSLSYKERKPGGYWDDVRNLQNEVIAAQKELGNDTSVLPSRGSLERSGHFNLARALEKWGGAKETARILGLQTKGSQKRESRSRKTSATPLDQNADGNLEGADVEKGSAKATARALGLQTRRSKKRESHLRKTSAMPLDQNADGGENVSQEMILTDIATVVERTSARRQGAGLSEETIALHNSPGNTSQAREKMPYKTGVPQESCKWLTLSRDGEEKSHPVNE